MPGVWRIFSDRSPRYLLVIVPYTYRTRNSTGRGVDADNAFAAGETVAVACSLRRRRKLKRRFVVLEGCRVVAGFRAFVDKIGNPSGITTGSKRLEKEIVVERTDPSGAAIVKMRKAPGDLAVIKLRNRSVGRTVVPPITA